MVWTTTPWTLPSNLALAVKADMDYVKIKDVKRNEIFIMAECRLKNFYGKDKKAY
jgi:isoleucyl-tRNA synthetase